MAEPQRRTDAEPHVAADDHFLLVEGRFYDDIGDHLLAGAKAALDAAGATHDVVTVPGALEVPTAIAIAVDNAATAGRPYGGAVAAKVIVLLMIIAFLQWRPEGLITVRGKRK